MKLRRLACVAMLAALCAASVQVVDAFYDDTHYSLTYFIARSCGYTPMQAWRVASADVAVDAPSSPTEPVQTDKVFTFRDIAQDSRVRFHAMWDSRLPLTDPSLPERANKGRELELMRQEQKNPGVLLHFIQDEEPHRGYTSWGGHWVPPPASIALQALGLTTSRAASELPYGATTDYLSYNQAHSFEMVLRTIDTLTSFIRRSQTHQRAGGMRCDANGILKVLAQLVGANPVSVQAAQYAAKVAEFAGKSTTDFENAMSKLPVDAQVTKAGPLVGNADAVIARALALQADTTPYKPFSSRLQYQYDRDGRNQNSAFPLHTFELYGTLNLDVETAQGKQVELSVWAASTRAGEAPYILECKPASGVTRFDAVPVGDLIVQTVADGKVTRTNLTFTADGRPVRITGAPPKKDDREKNQCSQPAVAAAATALCASSMLGSATGMTPAQTAQADTLAKDLETKLDDCKKDEQTKKDTNTQARQTTPGKSGSGVGTALKVGAGVGGAVAAGLVLKNALDDLSTLESPNALPSPDPSSGNAFNGSYTAQVSYSCTTSAGASEPCNRSFGGGGCVFETFSFSVSGGTVTEPCGWLTGSSLSSGGSYSGRYTGTASRTLPISGTFSSSFSLSGSDVFRGNSYRITIAVQKR